MNNLYDTLEICLQEIENGADIDTVLFRYPEFAEELRPILETVLKARSVSITGPSEDVVRRNRAAVLQHAAQLREAKAGSPRSFWSVSLRRALVSLAVIATLFVSSTRLVSAASTTLPGDNLYPVKRTWEDVLVLFTFNVQARQALEVEHENERLDELYELFAEGRSVPVDFSGYVTRQNGDLWLVSKIPVVISAQTDLRAASIVEGDAIRVRGVTQSDGTVLAERVDVLGAGVPLPDVEDDLSEVENENSGNDHEAVDDNSGPGSHQESTQVAPTERSDSEPREISLQGTVTSINGVIVIVNDQPMNIANAEIKGQPAAGQRVKVEGYYDANGMFIVTKIEFLQIDSGESNSGSNDNGNDSNDDSGDDYGDDNSNSNSDDNSNGGDDNSNDNGNDNSGSGGGGDD